MFGFLTRFWKRSACTVASALILLASVSVADAATYTYTGNANYGLDSSGTCALGLGGPGADSANWSDPRNWGPPCTPTGVPGAGDDAIIGDFTVILSSNATVHNLTFSPVSPTGGSIGAALDVTNNSTLTVTGAFTWTAGIIGYPAGHSASSGGTIFIPSGAQWLISGSSDKNFFESNDSVINDGDAIWSGGNIHLYQSGTNGIVNNGTFTTTTDASLIEDTAIAYDRIGFVNNGTFRKTAGSGVTSVTWAFTNHGVVDAQSGNIALAGGIENGGMIGYSYIHTGVFNAAAGATVDFAGNTHVLGDAVRFTGAGRVRITGGAVQTDGNPQIGTASSPGNFEIAGGAFNPGNNTGGQRITPTGSLVCSSSGKLYFTGGNIGGPINVQSGASANWTGGELDGIWNIGAGGTLNISGTGTRTLQGYGLANYGNQRLPGVLNNAGTTVWSGTCQIDIQYGDTGVGTRGAINNSGTFIAQNDQSFTGGGTFTNTGILRKQNSSGVTNFSAVTLNNRGSLDVRSGVLSLNTMNNTLSTGTVFSGAGRTRLSSGSVSATGNFLFANSGTFELASGSLTAPGGGTTVAPASFGGPGTFLWTGGEIGAIVNVGVGTKLNISGAAGKLLNGYGKVNYGNVNQPGLLNNAGIATWTGTGSVTAQYGGMLRNIRGGTFNVQTNANFGSDFTNSGTLNIGSAAGVLTAGIFNLGGNFTQTSTGVLKTQLGGLKAGSQFDQLRVSGTATLGGTVTPSILGSFVPATGNRFAFLTYNTRTGSFSTVTPIALSAGRVLRLNYIPTSAELVVASPPTITSFTPTKGPAGTVVTVIGTNLSDVSKVMIGNLAVTFSRVSATSIRFTVPATALSGKITLFNPVGSATSTQTFFLVPAIRSFTPAKGPVGTVVTVTGTNFTDVNKVQIGTTGLAFTRVSSISLRFTVPNTAVSGKITLSSAAGNAITTTAFLLVPTISSFTPSSGPIATSVLITGANLSDATVVKFGTTAATFTRISATQVRATVPAGATTGRISVTTAGGLAISAANFTMTTAVPKAAISSVQLSTGSATAATSSIHLSFNGALDAESAADAGCYLITVNGVAVAMESVQVDAGATGVTLGLPESTLKAGDRVVLEWSELRDRGGKMLQGEAEVGVR